MKKAALTSLSSHKYSKLTVREIKEGKLLLISVRVMPARSKSQRSESLRFVEIPSGGRGKSEVIKPLENVFQL